MHTRLRNSLLGLAVVILVAAVAPPDQAKSASVAPADAPVTVTDYTDPSEALQWGNRSHWKQPWRAFTDTMPATTMLNAVGINFNVQPRWAEETAQLLAASGFTRARIEVGWGSLDYDDPSRLTDFNRANLDTRIAALRDAGITANRSQLEPGMPCPVKNVTLDLLKPANAGDRHLYIDPADIDKITLGRTGLGVPGWAAGDLFTGVDSSGKVTLSQGLFTSVPAGPLAAITLRYEPFRPSVLPDGSPNPRFEPTLAAWLNYVGVVTQEVEATLGTDDFDVEIWNELSFGSAFLNINNYYEPDVEVKTLGQLQRSSSEPWNGCAIRLTGSQT